MSDKPLQWRQISESVPGLGGDQGGPLTADDDKKAAEDGGFTGTVVVGTDLASVRLPAK